LAEKTIILLGTGNSLRFCNFKASEIWGVNGTYTLAKGMPEKHKDKFWMTRLFMADTLFSFETGTLNFDIDGINEFAKEYNVELISLNKMRLGKHVLNAKQYPYRKIVKYFGCDLFTDTICYMIAYALYTHSYHAINPEGVIRPELDCHLRIKLYGIDMNTTREFQQSKGGVEHWIGVARGMGCEITNAPGSSIMSNPYCVPYGRWDLIKWDKKVYDPMGLLTGATPSIEDCDRAYENLKEVEGVSGTGITN